VHGRTREQLYTGKANWDILRDVKQAVNIPVIGNGDVFSPEDAKRLLEHTNCDGVMIGRGALGNPWMLYRTVHYLTTGELLPDPSPAEKIRIAVLHLDRLADLKGENVAVREMRKHLAWYLKGLPDSAVVKNSIMDLTTRSGVVSVLEDYVRTVDELLAREAEEGSGGSESSEILVH
jgi:nifR3 family TIM-barrel protein